MAVVITELIVRAHGTGLRLYSWRVRAGGHFAEDRVYRKADRRLDVVGVVRRGVEVMLDCEIDDHHIDRRLRKHSAGNLEVQPAARDADS